MEITKEYQAIVSEDDIDSANSATEHMYGLRILFGQTPALREAYEMVTQHLSDIAASEPAE